MTIEISLNDLLAEVGEREHQRPRPGQHLIPTGMGKTSTLKPDAKMGPLQEEEARAPAMLGSGRKPKALVATYLRDLDTEDLWRESDSTQHATTQVKTLRDRHHRLARAIALGKDSVTKIAKALGYSNSRIGTLMHDPAFFELVETYRTEIMDEFRTSVHRLEDMMTESSDILLDRLEQEPDSFTNTQLLDVVKTSADRTGSGPSSTQKIEGTVTVATQESIEAIKNKVKERQQGHVKQIDQDIEGQARDVSYTELKEISGPPISAEASGDSGTLQKENQAEGGASEGDDLRALRGSETQAPDQP